MTPDPLTRDRLDVMVCANPDCTAPHGPLFMHSACHPNAPTWASYYDGMLTITCAECDSVIAKIVVGSDNERVGWIAAEQYHAVNHDLRDTLALLRGYVATDSEGWTLINNALVPAEPSP